MWNWCYYTNGILLQKQCDVLVMTVHTCQQLNRQVLHRCVCHCLIMLVNVLLIALCQTISRLIGLYIFLHSRAYINPNCRLVWALRATCLWCVSLNLHCVLHYCRLPRKSWCNHRSIHFPPQQSLHQPQLQVSVSLESHLSVVCEFKIFIVCSTTVDYPENLGAIIGGAMGGFIFIIMVITVIVTIVCYRRCHHQQHQQPQPGMFNKSAWYHCLFTKDRNDSLYFSHYIYSKEISFIW